MKTIAILSILALASCGLTNPPGWAPTPPPPTKSWNAPSSEGTFGHQWDAPQWR